MIKVWIINEKSVNLLKSIGGHKNTVCSLVKFNDFEVISGSNDNTIKVWDLKLI